MTNVNDSVIGGAPTGIRRGTSKGKLLIAALLTGLLLTIGCSKEKSKPAGSSVQMPAPAVAIPISLPSASSPASPAPQTVSQKPVLKRAVRKHASMVTYKDDTYGLSFGYPRKYSLKNGEDLKSDSLATMNFVQPGGLTAVSVTLPDNAYPGTDLTSAFFQVNIHKGLGEAECNQFAVPAAKSDDKNAVQPSDVQIGDTNFHEVETINGESSKQVDTQYFHAFESGTCYEFALGLTTAWDGNEEGVNLVDREDVFRRLEKILAAVKITPETAPSVASDAKVAPTAQPEIVK